MVFRLLVLFACFVSFRAKCVRSNSRKFETAFSRVLEDGKICGYSDSAEEVERPLNRLKSQGFTYSVIRNKRAADDKNERFYFQQLQGNVFTNFSAPIFSVERIFQWQCTLGPKYYKKETAVEDHLVDHVNPCNKRKLIMDTKKSDCPATLDVKEVRVYPDYTINAVNDHWEKKTKRSCQTKKEISLPHIDRYFNISWIQCLVSSDYWMIRMMLFAV